MSDAERTEQVIAQGRDASRRLGAIEESLRRQLEVLKEILRIEQAAHHRGGSK